MADLRLRWNQAACRADWTIVDGDLQAGSDVESVLLLLLFTDRRAPDGTATPDGSGNLRGTWFDSFEGETFGSRLWLLQRRKIGNRAALAAEADDMVLEALEPMVRWGLATSVRSASLCPPAGPRNAGNLLVLRPTVIVPDGPAVTPTYSYTLQGY